MNRRGFIRSLLATAALSAVPFRWAWSKVPKIITGARARIYVNGKLIGYATGITYERKVTPIHTLGRYEPVELVPGEVKVEATLTRVVKGPEWDKLFEISDEEREALLSANPPVKREDIT